LQTRNRIGVFDAAGMQRINLGIETEIKLLDGCLGVDDY
jgi:hypothetical protein